MNGYRHMSVSGEAFIEALRLYGPTYVTDLLVRQSGKGDWLVDELLMKIPAVSSLMLFHRVTTTFEVDPEVLQRCLDKDPDFLKKQGIL